MKNVYLIGVIFFSGNWCMHAMEKQQQYITLNINNSLPGMYSSQEYEKLVTAVQKDQSLGDLFESYKNARESYSGTEKNEAIDEREYVQQELPFFVYLTLNGIIKGPAAEATQRIIQQFYRENLEKRLLAKRSVGAETDTNQELPQITQLFELFEKRKAESPLIEEVVTHKPFLQQMAEGLYKKGKKKVLYATLGACSLIGMALIKISFKKYMGTTT